MKIEIQNIAGNFPDAMRAAGYHYDGVDAKTKELRFYRSVSAGLYPRFHAYAVWNKEAKRAAVNLHLDQKAPVYEGATAHSGDYQGPVIEKEGERLKGYFSAKPDMPKIRPIE